MDGRQRKMGIRENPINEIRLVMVEKGIFFLGRRIFAWKSMLGLSKVRGTARFWQLGSPNLQIENATMSSKANRLNL